MRYVLYLATVLLLLAGAPWGVSAQTTALYDDFSAATIDPDKWFGLEASQGQGSSSNELIRRIVGGQAQQLLRATGGTGSNTGSTGPSARFRIGHPKLMAGNPMIQVMQAQMRIVEATVNHCAANVSVNSRIRAQMFGVFFNDGTGNNLAGDRTGDVSAGIQLVIDSVQGRRVEAFINRCTDPGCTTASISVGNTLFTRSWSDGTTNTVRVRWEPANNRFQFTANGPEGNETLTVPYNAAADVAKPKRIFHDVAQFYTLQNCAAGAVEGFMDLRFDNVRLDEAAVNATLP